jgi:hypothetical protein
MSAKHPDGCSMIRDFKAHSDNQMQIQKKVRTLREEVIQLQRIYRPYEVVSEFVKEQIGFVLLDLISTADNDQDDDVNPEEPEIVAALLNPLNEMLANVK